MTKDDIIRMAREAGANPSYSPEKWDIWEIRVTDLERFADLVATQEREECAKVCESYQDALDPHKWPNGYDCAAAIRARGKE